jgi:hypothetical protein
MNSPSIDKKFKSLKLLKLKSKVSQGKPTMEIFSIIESLNPN